MPRQRLLVVIAAAVLLVGSQHLAAQFSPLPSGPQTYTDYYTKHLRSYHRPPVNVRDYTIDKYFVRNPSISPYANLGRTGNAGALNNYYRYVRPEVQRRSALTTPSPRAAAPKTFNSNPYFNQIYNPIRR